MPPFNFATYTLGVDLGQRQDYTAIAVLESANETTGWDPVYVCPLQRTVYRVRHLERLPLGTPYTEVVSAIHTLAWKLESPYVAEKPTVVADATGVGAPVIDMLRRARLPGRIVPVQITGADKANSDGSTWRVPKRDLITIVQILLECRRLQFARRMPHAEELVKEMLSMRVRVAASGAEQYAPWRERDHDDLVLAVSLASWWVARNGASL